MDNIQAINWMSPSQVDIVWGDFVQIPRDYMGYAN